ncbi:MAG: DNA polymerase III subunit [Pirellulales bacterium]|nr:DNA polymerase III subunit [Pirellulales bacterium]
MWQGIDGHDSVVEHFRQSVSHNRLASSYLFLGPAGVGKRLFAGQLAQSLLCGSQAPQQLAAPCDSCESCRLHAVGNHPDVDVVSLPAGKRKLPIKLFVGDQAHRHQEGLCHNVSLRPMLGKRRVAIIDDADHLTTESSNSLLKTLEEPPPGAVLILIGTSRARQLPTIVSRTQVIRFEPLAPEIVRNLLLQKEIVAEPADAERLASISGGSMERASELADAQLGQWWERLLPQLTTSRFDSRRLTTDLTEFVNQAGEEAKAGEEANDRRRRLRLVFQLAGGHFRQALFAGCGARPPRSLAGLPPAEPSTAETALAAIDCCLEAEIALDRYANQATLLECWLDDLADILVAGSPSDRALKRR